MPKYRPHDILTQEQIGEVAILLNVGVPYKTLAANYGVSIATISRIAAQKSRWLPQEDITQDPTQKFLNAQKAYIDNAVSPQGKRSIEGAVLDPLAARIARGLGESLDNEPYKVLLRDVLGLSDILHEDYSLLTALSLVGLKQTLSQGAQYPTIDEAVNGLMPYVRQLREAAQTAKQKANADALKRGVQDLLGILTIPKQREVIELEYGLLDVHRYTRTEVARKFGVTNEVIRLHENKALLKMHHSDKAKKLADLLG